MAEELIVIVRQLKPTMEYLCPCKSAETIGIAEYLTNYKDLTDVIFRFLVIHHKCQHAVLLNRYRLAYEALSGAGILYMRAISA